MGPAPSRGQVRRASCPPCSASPPKFIGGGSACAGNSGCGEYAALRVLLGVEGKEKGSPPAGRHPGSPAPKARRASCPPECRPRCGRPLPPLVGGGARPAGPVRPPRSLAGRNASSPPAAVGILPRRVPPLPARRRSARTASLFHSFIIAYYDSIATNSDFSRENSGFAGFSACAAIVHFGTMAVSPAGLSGWKCNGPAGATNTHGAGSASYLGARERCPL